MDGQMNSQNNKIKKFEFRPCGGHEYCSPYDPGPPPSKYLEDVLFLVPCGRGGARQPAVANELWAEGTCHIHGFQPVGCE